MSGLATSSVVDVPASGPVQVVEVELETEDEGGEEPVAPSELPKPVIAALNARFPDAEILEADFSVDEEDGPEFGVSARFNDQIIDVTLTPAGQITETEKAISSDELPEEVLDWVRQNYPGAEIDEAMTVIQAGALNYEVMIATPEGEEYEALLHVPDAQPAGGEQTPENPVLKSPQSSFDPARSEVVIASDQQVEPGPGEAAAAVNSSGEPVNQQEQQMVAQAEQAALANSEQAGGRTATGKYTVRDGQATLFAEVIQAFTAGATPVRWIPQVAGALGDVVPIDVAAVEQKLQQVLHEIDLLAENVVAYTAGTGKASRLAMVGALAAGILLLLESRKPRGGPVLVFNAANSSWSWVLGTVPAKRPKGLLPSR